MRTKRGLFSQENKQLEGISAETHGPEFSGDKALKSSETDWTAMYSGLENVIKIRYSLPSTPKTYLSWKPV